MKEFSNRTVVCPHCGQYITAEIDASNGEQDFYDECSACCNSIHFKLLHDQVHEKYELFIDADDEQIF